MSREIQQENSFLQVLLKLIPSEVIAVFVFVQDVMPRQLLPHLVMALVLTALTPLYLRLATGVRSRTQLVLSTLSLVVWIYAMGTGPLRFVRAPFYEPWHGAVLLAVWTLVPPMLLTRAPENTLPPPRSPSHSPSRSASRSASRSPSRSPARKGKGR